MINHNKPYGVYGTLHQFDTYKLINVLIDSRVRLRALQNYTDELKTLCYQGRSTPPCKKEFSLGELF